jgi:hypothetical protein
MSESEKTANKVYLLAAETQLYAFSAYIVSIFGDIPFDEVGQVSVTGDVALAHPHYQDDKVILSNILDRLGEMNTEWAAIKEGDVPGSFSQQDFINKGDLEKWRRYNNSIRLKTALLVSTQGDLATKGQGVLKEILTNAANNPLIETSEHNVVMAQVTQSGSALDINGGSGFDWPNQRIASTEIINKMQAEGDGGKWSGKGSLSLRNADEFQYDEGTSDDPRLPIMFCMATPHGEFAVFDSVDRKTDTLYLKSEVNKDSNGEPLDSIDSKGNRVFSLKMGKEIPSVFRGACAGMDPNIWHEFFPADYRAYFSFIRQNGFFKDNRNWDNPIITAAEINFIKAEVFQRGWVTGDARDAFKKGISESIKSYLKYHKERSANESSLAPGNNSYSVSYKCVINPDESVYDDAWIDDFAEKRWAKRIDGSDYEGGKIEAILEQKWLNYGYMYAGDQWTDLRRTGYPRMYYRKDTDAVPEVPFPANRNRYPESERNNNKNFQAEVASQDNWSDVLFWAISDWHDGPTWDLPNRK